MSKKRSPNTSTSAPATTRGEVRTWRRNLGKTWKDHWKNMEIIEVSHKKIEPLKMGILHDLINLIRDFLVALGCSFLMTQVLKKIKRDESWRSNPQGTNVT